jgi:hypothetical protein
MPKGHTSSHTHKQKRQAETGEKVDESPGASAGGAKRSAWLPLNKTARGGKRGGFSSRANDSQAPASSEGKMSGRASAAHAKRVYDGE